MGILFALGAMVCWGVGDFYIQRSTKKFGDWESLFVISLTGSIIIVPFIYKDLDSIYNLFRNNYYILTTTASLFLLTALIYCEALKKGKLSVVEPLGALELPIVGLLATMST